MKPIPLPRPLTTIVVPDEFHPSGFAQLKRCPLSVLGLPAANEKGLLVPHPTALLGMILHHVRHEVLKGRWGMAEVPQQAVHGILAVAIADAEAALSSHDVTLGLVPLHESVGRRLWKSRTRVLDRWAANVTVAGRTELPRRLSITPWRASAIPAEAGQIGTGSEQTLWNRGLRLRGRPDWCAYIDDRHVEVVDFKSGRLTDIDGRLLDEHVIQVQLYALMLEAAFPNAKVRPFIEQVERIEVPWGEEDRTRLMARLQETGSELPAGARLGALDLALPGVHCRGCRLRPICPAYLATAPSWWPYGRGKPRPLPLDVWGEVASVQTQEGSVVVELTDAADRRVRIGGINPIHSVDALREGDEVWFFDLEASEDLSQHGALVQPRNFHEYPPGPRWQRARRVRVFRGP